MTELYPYRTTCLATPVSHPHLTPPRASAPPLTLTPAHSQPQVGTIGGCIIWLSYYSAQLIRNQTGSSEDVGFGVALLTANLSIIGGTVIFGRLDQKQQAENAKTIENLHAQLAEKSKTIAKRYKTAWAAYSKHAHDHGFDVATLMASLVSIIDYVNRQNGDIGPDDLSQPEPANDMEVLIKTMEGFNEKMHEVSQAVCS